MSMPCFMVASRGGAPHLVCLVASPRCKPAELRRIGMKGFRTFLLRGNIIDLAIAVVMGVAFNAIVQSLVKDVITPLVAAIAGQPDFSSLKIGIGTATVSYGMFLNPLISFLILGPAVHFLTVPPITTLP